MIAFKLTDEYLGSWSFVYRGYRPYTKYCIGKWTKPKKNCGPLACFSNYSELIEFKKEYTTILGENYSRIFVCEIKKSKSKKLWYRQFGFFKYKENVPNGTIFASAVKLLKEIK